MSCPSSFLLHTRLSASPPPDLLPTIAAIAAVRGALGREGSLLSSVASRSYRLPLWARLAQPRRWAHNADASLELRRAQPDGFEAASHAKASQEAWRHGKRGEDSVSSRFEGELAGDPEEEIVSQAEEPRSTLSPTPHAPSSATTSTLDLGNSAVLLSNDATLPGVIVAESKAPARRPASKTVLNGGISQRERAERKRQLEHISATLGVREAQATKRRLEREDEVRKEKRKALVKRLRPYLQRQMKLIELEAEEERREVEVRKTWTLEKLTGEGLTLDGMEGYWLQVEQKPGGAGEKGKKRAMAHSAIRTAVFHRPGKARLGWTKIQKGDQVELKRADVASPLDTSDEWQDEVCAATVRSVSDNEIRLNLEAPFHGLNLVAHPLWRIDLAYNDLIEQRLKESVQALSHDVQATQRAGAEWSGTRLVDMLLDGGPEARTAAEELTVAKWIEKNGHNAGKPDYGTLNETQRQAVELMLSEPISLVQGPPGTGKTSTIVAAIRLLKQHYRIPHPILLTSHTNVAVDNLAQGCKDAGLNVVRAGATVRVRESLNDITLDGLMEKHPSKARLDELNARKIATIKALQGLGTGSSGDGSEGGAAAIADEAFQEEFGLSLDVDLLGEIASMQDTPRLQKKLSLLMQKTFVLKREMETDIFQSVDVVCCTALSAPLLRAIDFPLVFFDEASMATEPIAISAMIKGCQQLSLIGDQKQLSPLVKSRQVADEGLGLSLFERLMERGDVRSVMLNTQHRMHPSLSRFPNDEFYDGRLEDAEVVATLPPVRSSYINEAKYLSFVNHKGRESVTQSKSLENNREGAIVVRIIADILCKNEDIRGAEIGIITPYLGQKELLWKSLQDPSSYLRSLLAREVARLGGSKSRLTEIDDIEIHTIDGFEGREKKVVVFSLVRANSFKYWGFLTEEKRWNVALTRAKNALVIVGNQSMLERAPTQGEGEGQDGDSCAEEESFIHRFGDHLRSSKCVIVADDVVQ